MSNTNKMIDGAQARVITDADREVQNNLIKNPLHYHNSLQTIEVEPIPELVDYTNGFFIRVPVAANSKRELIFKGQVTLNDNDEAKLLIDEVTDAGDTLFTLFKQRDINGDVIDSDVGFRVDGGEVGLLEKYRILNTEVSATKQVPDEDYIDRIYELRNTTLVDTVKYIRIGVEGDGSVHMDLRLYEQINV